MDDELHQIVDDVGLMPFIFKAGDDALAEADAVVELAQGHQAGAGADRTALEIEADSSVMAK